MNPLCKTNLCFTGGACGEEQFSSADTGSGSVNCIRDITTAKAIRQRLMDTLGISDPQHCCNYLPQR
ncbi:hypothetical protein [Chitinophaga pinensis]|uniref:hypothetical protein n=1 Tax=Chitinophaga pinensis TaxID=79329 RepID=UPI0011B6F4F2|nr:hypothetical protein [Chitinophaga pinensis]